MSSLSRNTSLVVIVLLLLNACRKQDLPVTDECKDCEQLYKNEKKIKKITATADSTVRTFDFTYLHHAIKTVTENPDPGTFAPRKYILYYFAESCLLSGYDLSAEYAPEVDGAFNVEGDHLVQRTETPDFRDPYTYNGYPYTSNDYQYDSLDRIIQDVAKLSSRPGYSGVIHINYDDKSNVSNIYLTGDTVPVSITGIKVDNGRNPFIQQDYYFYKIKILPYPSLDAPISSSFPAINSLFYFLTLNTNNALGFQYRRNNQPTADYSFSYTYTVDGYPSVIRMYQAAYSNEGKPGTPVLQEELKVEYL
jgi:hypothetical protein